LKFHIVEKGSGQSLLFLHGLGGNVGTWQHQFECFAPTNHVIAVDLPGYGRSDSLPEMNFSALAQWLQELLDTHHLDKAFIIGHSFGGMILQEFLAAHDSSVPAVVLYGTSPAFGRKEGEWQEKFVRARLQPLDDGKTLRELAPSIAMSLVGSSASAEAIELARQGIAAVPDETFRSSVLCTVDFDQRANLGKINIPCLVVVGEEDGNAPPPMMKKMADRIPTARFVCLPELGHLAHLENPDLFNDTLRTFFQSATRSY
jgi:3-oxoadipate enol-lactonase